MVHEAYGGRDASVELALDISVRVMALLGVLMHSAQHLSYPTTQGRTNLQGEAKLLQPISESAIWDSCSMEDDDWATSTLSGLNGHLRPDVVEAMTHCKLS